MNGKGDKDRTKNFNMFREAFEKIDWSVKKQKEDEKIMREDDIPYSFPSSGTSAK